VGIQDNYIIILNNLSLLTFPNQFIIHSHSPLEGRPAGRQVNNKIPKALLNFGRAFVLNSPRHFVSAPLFPEERGWG